MFTARYGLGIYNKVHMFCIIRSFRSLCGSGVDSASNINKYQEYFLGVKAAGA